MAALVLVLVEQRVCHEHLYASPCPDGVLQHILDISAAMQTAEKGKAVASSEAFYAADAAEPVTDWQDYSNYYDEYDDDEEVWLPL